MNRRIFLGGNMTGIADGKIRCAWAGTAHSIAYHDLEWGVPQHDDRVLFEFLILEGAQAGLSWETILKKREAYRSAFDRFDPRVVAEYGQEKVAGLLADAGIVRNRLKIRAAIENAQATLRVQAEFGTLDAYLWSFTGGRPIVHSFARLSDLPATSPESQRMSKDMLARGFRFVGPTICYALMQAVGMVNDHTTDCFRYHEVM